MEESVKERKYEKMKGSNREMRKRREKETREESRGDNEGGEKSGDEETRKQKGEDDSKVGAGDEGSQPNRESDHGGRGRGAGPSLPFWLAGLQMDAFTTN